jgi:hypothetical protein
MTLTPILIRLLILLALLSQSVPVAGERSWQTLRASRFFLHYQPRDERVARAIADRADAVFQTITADVGYTPSRSVYVYLCPTPECFAQKQPANVKLPDWAVGVAYPGLNRIVMRSALTPQEPGAIKPVEVFKHEFAHIVLEQALAERGGAPRWLSEGFSMYHARQWTVHGQRTIEEVALRDDFIPLRVLTSGFPSDEAAARIAYAQSFSLVAFMLNTYGQRIFHRFIEHLRQGADADHALRQAAGVSLQRFEREWQAALKQRYSWFAYLPKIGLFWFVLSLGFLVAYLVKRWKVKRIQQRWEAEEDDEFAEW